MAHKSLLDCMLYFTKIHQNLPTPERLLLIFIDTENNILKDVIDVRMKKYHTFIN